jgi:hypothetical protein
MLVHLKRRDMQKVYTVWDDGKNENSYRHVNEALERGSRVVSVSTTAPSEHVTGPNPHVGQCWAVTIFVLELPEDNEVAEE